MQRQPKNLDFAPVDPTDGRQDFDWKSKYPSEAARRMALEAAYLTLILLACPVLIYLLWTGKLDGMLGLSGSGRSTVARYGVSWLAGALGGTLFATKWLYHSVARGRWHTDRLYWRLLTPHLSGGLAFGVYAIASSSILVILDQPKLREGPTIVGLSFLVGYFSDNATAALARLADNLFGEQPPNPGPQAESPHASSHGHEAHDGSDAG